MKKCVTMLKQCETEKKTSIRCHNFYIATLPRPFKNVIKKLSFCILNFLIKSVPLHLQLENGKNLLCIDNYIKGMAK